MFRREMGSKRGSLPPKEGDLTCMLSERSGENGLLKLEKEKSVKWIQFSYSKIENNFAPKFICP